MSLERPRAIIESTSGEAITLPPFEEKIPMTFPEGAVRILYYQRPDVHSGGLTDLHPASSRNGVLVGLRNTGNVLAIESTSGCWSEMEIQVTREETSTRFDLLRGFSTLNDLGLFDPSPVRVEAQTDDWRSLSSGPREAEFIFDPPIHKVDDGDKIFNVNSKHLRLSTFMRKWCNAHRLYPERACLDVSLPRGGYLVKFKPPLKPQIGFNFLPGEESRIEVVGLEDEDGHPLFLPSGEGCLAKIAPWGLPFPAIDYEPWVSHPNEPMSPAKIAFSLIREMGGRLPDGFEPQRVMELKPLSVGQEIVIKIPANQ